MKYIFQDKFNGIFSISDAATWIDQTKIKPREYYSILLNFGDTITLHKDFKTYDVGCGEVCFITPGSYITHIDITKNTNGLVINFNQIFYCMEQHDKDLSCNGLLFGSVNDIARISFDDSGKANNQHLMEIMLEELARSDQNSGDMLRLLLKRLIIKSVRAGRRQLFKMEAPEKKDTDIMRQFKALVEKHFKEKHKVINYASLMFKSSKTLSNTFNLLQEKSPLRIIHDRIILEAKRQLIYTDHSVKEVGHYLGFDDPAQFSRLFKKITNQSPTDFRKKYS